MFGQIPRIESIIYGYVANEPKIDQTKNDHKLASFSIPVNRGQGEKETTTWVRITAWDSLVPGVQQFISKGKFVKMHGEFWTSEYEGKKYNNLNAFNMWVEHNGQLVKVKELKNGNTEPVEELVPVKAA